MSFLEPSRTITSIQPTVNQQHKPFSKATKFSYGAQVVRFSHLFAITNTTGNACKGAAVKHGRGYSGRIDSHHVDKQGQATNVHKKTKDFHIHQLVVTSLTKEQKHQMLKKYTTLKTELKTAKRVERVNAGRVSSLTHSFETAKQKLIDNGIELPKYK